MGICLYAVLSAVHADIGVDGGIGYGTDCLGGDYLLFLVDLPVIIGNESEPVFADFFGYAVGDIKSGGDILVVDLVVDVFEGIEVARILKLLILAFDVGDKGNEVGFVLLDNALEVSVFVAYGGGQIACYHVLVVVGLHREGEINAEKI